MSAPLRFVTFTLNPAVDCTLALEERLRLGGVHTVRGETRTPGGKALNVAKVLAANGRPVCVCGLLGRDQARVFRGFLAAAGIRSRFCLVPAPTRENVMLSDAHGAELKVNRPGFPGLRLPWARLRRHAEQAAAGGRVVVLTGSLPAALPPATYARLVRRFHALGKTVVVDTSGPALAAAVAARPAVIKPNRTELERDLGLAIPTRARLVRVLRELAARHEVVILSDGARGAWFAAGGRILYGRPPPVRAVDTTGAGDYLLGQFCADYFDAAGRVLTPAIVSRAVAAGAAAVELHGTPLPARARIAALARAVRIVNANGASA